MIAPSLESNLDFLPKRSDTLVSFPLKVDLSFLDIASRCAHLPGTVVLASGGSDDCARYNILGIKPWLSLKAGLTHATIESAGRTRIVEADPLDLLQTIIRYYKLPHADYPQPICAGLFGYLSYDLKDCIEVLPRTSVDDLHLPHLYMAAPSIILVEDRFEQQQIVHVSTIAGDADQRTASFERLLAGSPPEIKKKMNTDAGLKSGFARDEYMRSIDIIRDYILRGHVYQVNMSQRFETSFTANSFDLFTSLFERNPASFFAYVNAGDHHIVSTSPERFIEARGRRVETRPIKGTRPRGKTPQEDAANRDQLANSRKDDAELSMIVDLLRNDIGKVCSAGSVKVREHKRVEAYENVFHLVSIIEGVLDDDKDMVDLVRATFPGGSITGCPKIRSMEIIDELEPVRRHIYTGSIGYIGFHDTMDLSIAIRTAAIKDDRLVFSVGGGIVYDSDPADEFDETLHKGKTLMNAIGGGAATRSESPPAIAWYNGKFKPLDDIAVSVKSEGFLYGYGIFETIRVHHGVPFRLGQHLRRFNLSWQQIFGTKPPDITWNDVVTQVVERCGLTNDSAAVKILAASGEPGKPETMSMLVTARPYTHRLKTVGRDGLYCAVYPYRRCSHLATYKTMNYMFYKMANKWAQTQGADESIILNHDGSICETATANILCLINGKWHRPASDHVLPGTMEKAVCDLLKSRGETIETRSISLDELKAADHVFLTNALMGIVPVHRIDGQAIPGETTGLCEQINANLIWCEAF
ncbi:MAG: aminodeoxychorismate synthase component I [Chitinivibrionales bacterium]